MSEAFNSISAVKNVPLFIFGDHASKHIPTEYDNLGLSGDDLTRHIAWDIGTETIVRELCAYFGCGGQLAGVSRLVIDLNRELNMPGLIPKESDGTYIPKNDDLSAVDRQNRIDRFYTPYHNALTAELDKMMRPFVLSVHSFTPQPLTGHARETEIGLLVRHDETSAKAFQSELECHPRGFNVGVNKPYSAYDLNHTVDFHLAPRGLRHLAIELRQDLVDRDHKATAMANVIAACLSPLL